MRVAVLSSPDAWHYRDLRRAAEARDGRRIDVFSFDYQRICAELGGKQPPGFNLQADCVVVRTMPAGSLQQVVFRMDLLARLEHAGVVIFNPPKTIEAAVDKYLSLALLNSAGIGVPETKVAQSLEEALGHFEALGRDSVVKPLFGSMGFGIERLENVEQAKAYFLSAIEAGNVIYQQQFVKHDGFDIRLLVIGEDVVGMKRTNNGHWVTNIGQGGVGTPYVPNEAEQRLAIDSARAVGATFAGVDLIYESGTSRPLVVEVNAVPGWRATSKVLGVDVAEMMLAELERAVVN